jgi:type I restriction-modification system DNA methylase subunit
LKESRFDAIVMNPPFSKKYTILDNAPKHLEHSGMRMGYYILTKCMEMSDNIIALMPWFTLSDSDVRLRYLRSFGIKSITALPRKTFEYARIQTCVIELQKGYQGPVEFKIFDFKDQRYERSGLLF